MASLSQDHLLRHYHEELRGGQYIAQVAHDRQIYDENAVEWIGDHYIHVPRGGHREQRPQLEHMVRRYDHRLLLLLPDRR